MFLKDNLYRYLKQQKELFGDLLFVDKHKFGNHKKNFMNGYTLQEFHDLICLCKKCNLAKNRNQFVFGKGDANADLMFVGEAPGEKEDQKGEPFVGRAGKLLDKILRAINKNREKDVFITNVVKCRPPNNRDPLPSEIEKCEPYLKEQISMINPKLIVALGLVAARTLLKIDIPLKKMRGITHSYAGIPLRVTYHPAALLRNQKLKKGAWEDFQWVQNYLNTN
tara:strand:- start:60 stop:728 length:669 start_codon:yes stop_codon:yes gene_type:complete